MKNLNFNSLALILVILTFSCSINNTEEVSSNTNYTYLNKSTSSKIPSDALLVEPSGDITGVTDANNIEDALNNAKSTGGTVYLSDQNNGTVDQYYISRNIVIDGFNGSLIGEGKNKTIINAGRQSSSIGFAPAYSPIWTYLAPWEPLSPCVLQLDNSTGNVTIKDLTILIKDDQPTDVQLDGYYVDGTYIWTFIEIIGGEHNTTIENINLEGKESNAYGNVSGFNAAWAIHVMPWANPPSVEWPFQPTKGNLSIKNISIKNVAYDAILFMDFKDGSEININNINAHNVGYGLTVRRIMDSFINITDFDVYNHNAGWAHGMKFFDINSGLKVSENQFSNAKWFASVYLSNVHQSEISKNKFINITSFGAALALSGGSTWNTVSQNDYTKSELPGWTTNSPDGPGAVWLRNDTENNNIFEMKFPSSSKKTLCEMIQDNGDNVIANWQACENTGNKLSADSKEKFYLNDIKYNNLRGLEIGMQ